MRVPAAIIFYGRDWEIAWLPSPECWNHLTIPEETMSMTDTDEKYLDRLLPLLESQGKCR